MIYKHIVSLTAISCALILVSCQKRAEPVPSLTQVQWQRIQEHLLDEEPDVQVRVNAVFGDRIELIGYDLDPSPRVQVGGELTVTWYWRVLTDIEDRWEIFCHLDSQPPHRQNLDHEAIEGLYTAVNWEKDQIIRDQQTVTLDHEFGNSTITILIGFWRRTDNTRLEVTDAGEGSLAPEVPGVPPRLRIGTFETYRDVETLEARRLSTDVTIDGRLNERPWRNAPRTEQWVHPNSGEAVSGLNTHARALWDDEALYIGLSARDTDIWATITERDGNLWDEEVLEVYLDPGGDGRNYLEIQVNPLGTLFDALFPEPTNRDLPVARAQTVEGMEVGHYVNGTVEDRSRRDNRWSIELRIPWSSLPDFEGPPGDGTVISANFYQYDRPSDGSTLTSAWTPVHGGSFHQPDKFGQIMLVDREAVRGDQDRTPAEGTGAQPMHIRGTPVPTQLEVVHPLRQGQRARIHQGTGTGTE